MARNVKNTSPLIRTRLKKMHLTDKTGELVATDIEKVKVLNFFFCLFSRASTLPTPLMFPHLKAGNRKRRSSSEEPEHP